MANGWRALLAHLEGDLAGLTDAELEARARLARAREDQALSPGLGRNPKAGRDWRAKHRLVEDEIERRRIEDAAIEREKGLVRAALRSFQTGQVDELARQYVAYASKEDPTVPGPMDWFGDVASSTELEANRIGALAIYDRAMQIDPSDRMLGIVALGPLDNLLASGKALSDVSMFATTHPNIQRALDYWTVHGYGPRW